MVRVRPEGGGRGRSPEELTHEHCQGRKRRLIFPTIEGEETEAEPARQLCHWTRESRLPWDSQPFVYRPPYINGSASAVNYSHGRNEFTPKVITCDLPST